MRQWAPQQALASAEHCLGSDSGRSPSPLRAGRPNEQPNAAQGEMGATASAGWRAGPQASAAGRFDRRDVRGRLPPCGAVCLHAHGPPQRRASPVLPLGLQVGPSGQHHHADRGAVAPGTQPARVGTAKSRTSAGRCQVPCMILWECPFSILAAVHVQRSLFPCPMIAKQAA